jgi:hypothetical protein
MTKLYHTLVGKPEGITPLVKHRHRWEDNIKMDFKEMKCVIVNWIHLAQDRGQ